LSAAALSKLAAPATRVSGPSSYTLAEVTALLHCSLF
jgi:hypothetical protein